MFNKVIAKRLRSGGIKTKKYTIENDYTLFTVYLYSDESIYRKPIDTDMQYELRYAKRCKDCKELILPYYKKGFASCNCKTQKWPLSIKAS